jgi:cytochrome c oxidase cbb3-type subunit 2
LIAYLGSLKSSDYAQHIRIEQMWLPAASVADVASGARLFNAYCATCHEATGLTRTAWRTNFKRLPPNLQNGPWLYLPASDSDQQRAIRLARIIKFGIPGTDMPGHEYLSDQDVSSIALWLNSNIVRPGFIAATPIRLGETQ